MTVDRLKILIVDDSSTAIRIATDLLQEAGHEVISTRQPEQALERLHSVNPDLVICDLMMPGVNGFEVLQTFRAEAGYAQLRIIMASAKPYEADQNKAKKLGADGYIVKPFTLEKFNVIMSSLATMKVSAWGVRGTLPTPQEGYVAYGGNTSCYSLEISPQHHLVFDAGTGIKNCGDGILKASGARVSADLFITHPHWDHINAFPFFAPLYIPGNAVRVHGSAQDEIGFERLILSQMDGTYFPVTAREFGAQVSFHEIGEQEINIDGVRVRSMLLKHPGNCLGYRVDYQGRSFCYITDNELYPEDSDFADEEFLEKLAEFCRGTNILLHDCTYFDDEYRSKLHWGHSSLSEVCRLAHMARAERLWIHHHDPSQTDEDIKQKLDFCSMTLAIFGSSTQAVLPTEGTTELV